MMTRAAVIGFVMVMVGNVAACGDPIAQPDAAQAQVPVATIVTASASEALVAPTDIAAIEVAVTEPVPQAAAAALSQEATIAQGPLGGVTIDDPFPAQTDAISDPAVAETAVRYAYQHWILIDFDKHLRARLIENGEANVDGLDGVAKSPGKSIQL